MKLKAPKKFVIKRSKWLRGDTDGRTRMRVKGGKMCCLGFYAMACGVPPSLLLDKGEPDDVTLRDDGVIIPKLTDKRGVNTNFTENMIGINDSVDIDESSREERIKAGFKRRGVEVKFV